VDRVGHMDEAQLVQVVDLVHRANDALIELGGRLPSLEEDDIDARGAYQKAMSAVAAAVTILDS
jgi:hypothetical protein